MAAKIYFIIQDKRKNECLICGSGLDGPTHAGEYWCPRCDVSHTFNEDFGEEEKMITGYYDIDANLIKKI